MNEVDLNTLVESCIEPSLEQSLGKARAVRQVRIVGDTAEIELTLGFPVGGYEPVLIEALLPQLRAGGWTGPVRLQLSADILSHAVQRNLKPIKSIRNIIAVASGKGGVGKSTVAANLALALRHQGATVGLLDADIYGPSQPLMMGLQGQRPVTRDGKSFEPLLAYGVEVISIGFLIDDEQPMVWRGPMVTQALTQLINDTNWGALDYLIVDMPPGTGDTQLTLAQRVPVSGAVIVTTPQDIALLDARKGLKMFEKVEVPVLGVIENMSTHVCSSCGHEEPIFGTGGGARMAEQYHVRLLGSLPLDMRIREQADSGKPTVAADPDGRLGSAYQAIARRTAACLAAQGRDYSRLFPKITVEDS